MKITLEQLIEMDACEEAVDWFREQNKTDVLKLYELLKQTGDLSWGNWIITRLMVHKQQIQYAVFAAEQVIDIFEREYPDDKRPREAIEAARKCIDNTSEGAARAAARAARAARAASYASYASSYATYAADAAYAAVYYTDNATNATVAILVRSRIPWDTVCVARNKMNLEDKT